MIRSLEINNFNSIKTMEDVGSFSNINIFYGKNNAGKSNILKTIPFLAQSRESINFSGSFVDLNSFEDTVHKKLIADNIVLQVIFELAEWEAQNLQELSNGTVFEGDSWTELGLILEIRNPGTLAKFTILSDETTLLAQRRFPEGEDRSVVEFHEDIPIENETTGTATKLFDFNFKKHAEGENEIYGEIIHKAQNIISQNMENTHYFQPLRNIERKTQSTSSERVISPTGENIVYKLYILYVNEREKFDQIADWADKFGIANVDINVDDGIAIPDLEDPKMEIGISLQDIGFGTNQLLPFMTKGFASEPGTTMVIEEPETHLYPGAQMDLLELFQEITNNGKQIFVTTHSERLLAEAKELGEEGEEEVKVFKVEKNQEGTQAESIHLPEIPLISPFSPGYDHPLDEE